MAAVLLSAFLIRNPEVNTQDDRITVFKNGDGLLVKYYDAHTKRNYELKMENDDLGAYVKNVCRMFSTDEEPFAKLQLNFHGFPTYMMLPNSVTEERLSMLNRISWMVTDSFFGEVEDDLPPLLPIPQQRVSACEGNSGCTKPGCYRY